jgi:ubiquinone/menaquinone biosynthesis C-methylase UbiE
MHGIYPVDLLFDDPWLDWAWRYPLLWLDLPNMWRTIRNRQVHAIPTHIDREAYPDYYLQTFHYQTDGYLSDHSASLYDLQVEILFNGMADAMRRRILAPIRRWCEMQRSLHGRGADSPRILDVATGTGSTLRQLRGAFPEAALTGIDLSEAYLREGRRWMETRAGGAAELLQANAEQLPFEDGSFDVVSCVFLFHELPRSVRGRVAKECLRVLRPGGLMVLADSIQSSDAPIFASVLEWFRRTFHEPFFGDYLNDRIEDHLADAGFQRLQSECHLMSKVWSCRRPASAAQEPGGENLTASAVRQAVPAACR